MAAFAVYQALGCLVGLRLTYDVVLVTNPAVESGLPFLFFSVLRRKPSLFCVWDLYPEVGITLGVFRRPAVISLVKILEGFCLRQATAVQTLADAFVRNLKQRVGRHTEIHVIPPWIDTEFITPLPRTNRFSAEHGLNERFVVLYAGNLGLSQGLDNVLPAAKGLSSNEEIFGLSSWEMDRTKKIFWPRQANSNWTMSALFRSSRGSVCLKFWRRPIWLWLAFSRVLPMPPCPLRPSRSWPVGGPSSQWLKKEAGYAN